MSWKRWNTRKKFVFLISEEKINAVKLVTRKIKRYRAKVFEFYSSYN